MENHKIRVAITQGDTNGIGYELIFKAFSEPEMLELCTPIIYGSPKVAAYHSNALQTQCQFSIINNAGEACDGRVNLLACIDEEVKVELGQSTNESALAAFKALDKALADGREGLYDVLVCGPMDNSAFKIGSMQFPGTMKYIEQSVGNGNRMQPVYLSDSIRVALASNADVKDVPEILTKDGIESQVKSLYNSLLRDFRLSDPRVAVLALNPNEGTEEAEVIRPAVETLVADGMQVFGPYQAETFFDSRQYEAFDAILAMHHDQGLIPARMLSYSGVVVALLNIPFICTLPDTNARMDIAGKDMADENLLRQAIYTAIDIRRSRAQYDEPYANPLPKLYHERPDNGEKLRFSIPKKREDGHKEQ